MSAPVQQEAILHNIYDQVPWPITQSVIKKILTATLYLSHTQSSMPIINHPIYNIVS